MSEPIEVGVRKARANFSRYLKQAREGTPVVIKSRGEADVRLVVDAPALVGPRPWGLMKGKIKYLTDNWEDDLPLDTFDLYRDDA